MTWLCWIAIPQPMLDAAPQPRSVVLLTRMVDLRLSSAVHECAREVEQDVLGQMRWLQTMARKRAPLLQVLVAPLLGSGLV